MALEFGVDVLGVNSIEEFLILRRNFPLTNILLMGEVSNKEIYKKELADENLWIVVSRTEDVNFLASLTPRPKIHLKIDTGMSRLGHSGDKMHLVLEEIAQLQLPLDGLMTHFASTEDFTEHSYSMQQLQKFQYFVNKTKDLGFSNLIRHAAASASTMLFEEAHFDMVRIGISLYGLWPSLETRLSLSQIGKNFSLSPVLTWKTKIVHIQSVPSGTFVGYGSSFKTVYPSRIAVIPVGYHEGWNRRLSNLGHVLINKERAPILGRVCMNMSMIDITHIETADLGTEVILLGRSGKENLSADTLANLTNTINYDIVTSIQKDIPRIFKD
jgi:alanine racemase